LTDNQQVARLPAKSFGKRGVESPQNEGIQLFHRYVVITLSRYFDGARPFFVITSFRYLVISTCALVVVIPLSRYPVISTGRAHFRYNVISLSRYYDIARRLSSFRYNVIPLLRRGALVVVITLFRYNVISTLRAGCRHSVISLSRYYDMRAGLSLFRHLVITLFRHRHPVTFLVPLHSGYPLQLQNSLPELTPFFATRLIIGFPQTGQLGAPACTLCPLR